MQESPPALRFPYPPKELSPNARVMWPVRQRVVRAYKDECYFTAFQQLKGKPTCALKAPVTAYTTFVVKVDRKRDEDNLSASLKALWDGLVLLGLLAGDDAARLHHAPIAIEKGKEACVMVRLEAAS